MANTVKIIFEGDAAQLFQLADAVENRVNEVNKNVGGMGGGDNAAMQAQQANIQRANHVRQQAAQQTIQTEQNVTRAVVGESEKRIAAKKREAEAVTTAPQQRPFDPNDPAIVAERNAKRLASEKRVNADLLAGERQSAELASQFRRRQFQERIASGLQESRILTAQLATRTAAIQAGERAVTATVVAESVKQRVARRSALLGEGSFLGGLTRGAGFGGLPVSGPAAIGFTVAAGTVLAINRYNQEVTSSAERTARLRVASDELGIAQQELAGNIDRTARQLRISKDEAESIVGPLGELSSAARGSLTELNTSVQDVASARGIDKDRLPSILRNIAEGSADAAVFGRNAASIFDLYAASIGKTANQLTLAERQTALYNQLTQQGAQNAGAAANAINQQAVSLDALQRSADKLLQTAGGFASGPAKNFIDLLTGSLGGDAEFGRFDPGRALAESLDANTFGPFGRFSLPALIGSAFRGSGKKPEEIYAEDLKKAEEEVKKRHGAFLDAFNADRKLIEDAIANPNANIVNRGLSTIDLASFLKMSPEQRQAVKQTAIANAKEIVGAQVQEFKTEVERAGNNIPRLQFLRQNLGNLRGLIDPDEFKRLADSASKAINDSFRDIVQSAGQNVPRLREIYQQIQLTPELLVGDKADLSRAVSDAIEQAVAAGKARADELGKNMLSAFDSVRQIQGSRNPYVRIFNEADQRLQQLRENTRGFSADIRRQMEEIALRERNLQAFEQRIDDRLKAFDLQDQARQFRAGQLDDPNNFRKLNERLEEQIRLTGAFKRVPVALGQVGGGRLPAETIFGTEWRPNQNLSPEERRLSNQFVISRTQGLDPTRLSPFVRDAAASAREQEAKAILDAEKTAQAERVRQSGLLSEINAGIKTLHGLAASGGVQAVNSRAGESSALPVVSGPSNRDEIRRIAAEQLDAVFKRYFTEKGIRVDLQGQAITNVEVTSRALDAQKREMGTRPSGADAKAAMEP